MDDLAVNLNPNQVSPGLLGFLVVCVLGVLIWMLCRNMGKHLERMENNYKAEQAAAEVGPEIGPDLISDLIRAQAASNGAKAAKSKPGKPAGEA